MEEASIKMVSITQVRDNEDLNYKSGTDDKEENRKDMRV